ncbi:hypothetical protein [Streptomyces scopuliridis]|uniref:Uncharacterized protein n=1 Tax=Streptomyces scopuliridis TaxID=452529 RepID=A0ACD4ZSJ3_9ACTN|nr:hypothetical protein [Streptomyces scopuliridis]WSC01261.1 hypothetical protein OG835_32525 [Streptomyces scopuliridis]
MNELVKDIIREIGTPECVAALEPEFTAEEEALLERTAPNTARMNLGQLQGYRDAYAPSNFHGRTREDDLCYEAIRRELAKRDEATN